MQMPNQQTCKSPLTLAYVAYDSGGGAGGQLVLVAIHWIGALLRPCYAGALNGLTIEDVWSYRHLPKHYTAWGVGARYARLYTVKPATCFPCIGYSPVIGVIPRSELPHLPQSYINVMTGYVSFNICGVISPADCVL